MSAQRSDGPSSKERRSRLKGATVPARRNAAPAQRSNGPGRTPLSTLREHPNALRAPYTRLTHAWFPHNVARNLGTLTFLSVSKMPMIPTIRWHASKDGQGNYVRLFVRAFLPPQMMTEKL